jgi:predicted metalloendopeptidase
MQLPAFGKAFACKSGNAMLSPEAEQLSIWK